MKLTNQNRRALRLLDEWRRIQFRETENTVSDNEQQMPDVIWARRDKTWDRVDGFGGAKYIRAARGDEPEQFAAQVQPALSDEDAQILELGRLMRQVRDKENVDVELYLWNDGSECISVNGHRVDYVMMDKPIAYLRSRLAPKPQRPTAESMIAGMRKCKTSDDLWDWWQDTLEDWHAAGGDDGDD